MYAYRNPWDEAKWFFRQKSMLSKLILINVAVFILVNVASLFLWLFQVNYHPSGLSPVTYFLAVPASLNGLLLRPWTLLTYMFLQENFFHILFNMMVLYFGGRIFTEYLSERKLLNTYIIGGLTGALFYIVAYNVFPVFSKSVAYSVALGSSASVLAVLVAISTYVPEYSVILMFFGRVKLKYLALAIVLIDLLSISHGNAGGHIAHLGGAFYGFVYILSLKKGNDLTVNFGTMNFSKFFRYFTRKKKSSFYDTTTTYHGRPLSDEEYNYRKKKEQERIDKILEKISKRGYSSLTKEEKELLFKSSNNK
jgi:membrane associated rhomboid family serine protease